MDAFDSILVAMIMMALIQWAMLVDEIVMKSIKM